MSHSVPFRLETLHNVSWAQLKKLTKKYEAGDLYDPLSQYKQARNRSEEPVIPAPSLFQTLKDPPQDESATDGQYYPSLLELPSVSECAVHLELLELFFDLRTLIINSSELDATFGVEQKHTTVYRRELDKKTRKYVSKPHKLLDGTWTRRRREKWIFYLNIAVGRFLTWAQSADEAIKVASEPHSSRALVHLPPVDILMVWHAFLLNPEKYKEYCWQHKLKHLYRVSFPWKRIHEAIDSRTLTYTLPEDASRWSQTIARLHPDLYEFLASRDIPSTISVALKSYGELKEKQLWAHRPKLKHSTATDRLSVTGRGFIDAYVAASRDKIRGEMLVANVQRQASFVDKMHRHLWIRSPAVKGTIRRAIDRYDEFLQLFKLHPGTMLVPTLDIDLAWHTHQLSPEQYRTGCEERAGRFIDHDDKIVQGRLDSGYDKTKELYHLYFGKTYSGCVCWDCEAISSALEKADEEYDDLLDGVDLDAVVKEVKAEVEYHRVVEMVRRKQGEERLPVLRTRS